MFLGRYIPQFFILFVVMVNGIVSLISLFIFSLLVYRNAKVGCQEIPGIIGKFGLGVQNGAGQRLIVLSRGYVGHSKHPFPITQEVTLHIDISKWLIPKLD